MDPSFVKRRVLLAGLLPTLIALALLGYNYGVYAAWVLIYPGIIWVVSYCIQKKFRLWAFDDIVYIKRGIFGESGTLLNWNKLQLIQVKQSIFQRRKGLASLTFYTAGGAISIHFIPVEAARQVADYALYVSESGKQAGVVPDQSLGKDYSFT